MRFLAILATFASIALAAPTTLLPRSNTTTLGCFDTTKVHCVGRQAPISPENLAASTAIQKACAQVLNCVPGTTYSAVKGTVPQYTATLTLGKQCAGVSDWAVDKCVALFNDVIDATCDAQWPARTDLFQLGYVRAPCDDTFLSFNFGG
ncbi:hypothetical protein BDV96DRAFT_654043 [Lophiotrema nucula]|uniref:Uncharacterized protein n=1 Tax=Lophiotrema nucula TaxID=690887 RepID=A0A6A5YJF6_9PLEO|nr:hypothetical protein BDV96DRAFT_654043 [Lophiotrema nucula]